MASGRRAARAAAGGAGRARRGGRRGARGRASRPSPGSRRRASAATRPSVRKRRSPSRSAHGRSASRIARSSYGSPRSSRARAITSGTTRMKARSAVPVLIEYFRPAQALGEGLGERLHVVQEEAPPRVAQLLGPAAAAHLLDALDQLHDLLGERSLGDPAAPDPEHLDLALERRGLVLVERADDVVGERLRLVRVELPPGQAHEVGRVQPRVLGVDRDEELHDLLGVERVEEDRRARRAPGGRPRPRARGGRGAGAGRPARGGRRAPRGSRGTRGRRDAAPPGTRAACRR